MKNKKTLLAVLAGLALAPALLVLQRKTMLL